MILGNGLKDSMIFLSKVLIKAGWNFKAENNNTLLIIPERRMLTYLEFYEGERKTSKLLIYEQIVEEEKVSMGFEVNQIQISS